MSTKKFEFLVFKKFFRVLNRRRGIILKEYDGAKQRVIKGKEWLLFP
jgi:hypothetical protein